MMGRAERRRTQKLEQKAKTATYNLTKEQLNIAVREQVGKELERIKQEATDDAVNTATQIGDFAGIGFINALIDNVSKAGKAGREIAKSSIDGLNDVISRIADYVDADMDVQPTIRPVLDLSAVEAGTGRLNTLFSRNQALSVSTGMNERVSEMEVQNGESSSAGNTYQFTQNNYSPKALSRIDIYRQTKNQFSAMKGLVSNT